MNLKSLIFLLLCAVYVINVHAQVAEKAEDICPILVGEKVTSSILKDEAGNPVDILNKINEKPTVLVFYRGGWCPFCNVQLAGLAQVQQDILNLGYQIVAISPDDYSILPKTEHKNKVNYTLLSDIGGTFIQQLGIGFKTPAQMKTRLESNKDNGQISEVMPVPSVFILSKEGTVLFEYINPNYKNRISEEMLLALLKAMKI
jgi:peroxiredoxin